MVSMARFAKRRSTNAIRGPAWTTARALIYWQDIGATAPRPSPDTTVKPSKTCVACRPAIITEPVQPITPLGAFPVIACRVSMELSVKLISTSALRHPACWIPTALIWTTDTSASVTRRTWETTATFVSRSLVLPPEWVQQMILIFIMSVLIEWNWNLGRNSCLCQPPFSSPLIPYWKMSVLCSALVFQLRLHFVGTIFATFTCLRNWPIPSFATVMQCLCYCPISVLSYTLNAVFCSLALGSDFDLVFKRKSTQDVVLLDDRVGIPNMESLTVAMFVKADSRFQTGTLFAYSVPGKPQDIFILSLAKDHIVVTLKTAVLNAPFNLADDAWHSVGVVWDGMGNGSVLAIYMDGLVIEKLSNPLPSGEILTGGGWIALGQRLTASGPAAEASDSFVGSLHQVNLWNVPATKDHMWNAAHNCTWPIGGSVKAWINFLLGAKGKIQRSFPTKCKGRLPPTQRHLGHILNSSLIFCLMCVGEKEACITIALERRCSIPFGSSLDRRFMMPDARSKRGSYIQVAL